MMRRFTLPCRALHALAAALTCLAAGCASFAPPQPWEKGTLARPEMQIDPDPLETRIQQHIYTSKEAATGGYGVGGGGCGCN
jgi:type IV pilus biogenesis protein CpaD/CtpE